jgi:hypothetical protein
MLGFFLLAPMFVIAIERVAGPIVAPMLGPALRAAAAAVIQRHLARGRERARR